MASIEYRKKTARVVAYIDKQKHCFPLGRVTKKTAERFANNIDTLLHERRCNLPISREVSNWLADLDDRIYSILAERRLVDPRIKAGTLSEFIEQYIAGRTDVSERRHEKLRQAKGRLIEFFGDVDLRTVTAGAADEYSRWLLKQVAATTAQKECQIAAQFFRHAFRKEMIPRNPFEGVSVGTSTNDERLIFLAKNVITKVIDTCPDRQWRTVVALARYGGLRCSSEVALLKWSDIHWDTERFMVTSPKTKRYGKGTRIVPIFPELRPFLDEAFSMAGEGESWVVPMLEGEPSKNLGTTFKKIIRRAGLDPWPKPFQNLRSSRQTELEQKFPTYVVCKWLGNTPNIAHKHYLTVTDDHYHEAVRCTEVIGSQESSSDPQTPWGQTGDKRGTQPLTRRHKESQEKTRTPQKVRENATFAEVVAILENGQVAGTGFEPATSRL
jgi:integrase